MTDPQLNPEWKAWPVSERVAQLAAYHCDVLHVQERAEHDNRGDWVDKYESIAGLVGAPWCLLFQMWILAQCGVPQTHMPPKRMRGATHAVAAWAAENGKTVERPERGDIFLMLNGDGKSGHAGLFLGLTNGGSSMFNSIEGNTNEDGSREGYEIARKKRDVHGDSAHRMVFVRIR